jgi:hypothetical protein
VVVRRRAAAPAGPQPDGTILYELVTGHPDRAAHGLVFLTDLAVELRAWAYGTWTALGLDPQAAADAVIAWRGGHVKGGHHGGLTAEEALALEHPAMTYYARAAPRADCPAAPAGLAPVAAPHQRTPPGRPLPVAADTRRLRQDPLADTAGPGDRTVGPDRGHRTPPQPSGWPHPDTVLKFEAAADTTADSRPRPCGTPRPSARLAAAVPARMPDAARLWPAVQRSQAGSGCARTSWPVCGGYRRGPPVSTLVAGVRSSAGHASGGVRPPRTPA